MRSPSETKIAIVGGGLVGALEACFLATRGYQVSIFERRHDGRSERGYFGRSINLAISHRGLSALGRLGLDGFVKTNAVPMKARMIHSTDGAQHPIPYDPQGRCINSIERAGLNNFLLSYVESLPNVQLYFNYKLAEMNVDLDEPELTFEVKHDDNNTEIKKFNFNLIVGCDGAHSTVRSLLLRSMRPDFSQTYIEHGYMEFRIPPKESDNEELAYHMNPNNLHIWPRGKFMMIALPNQDFTFTCTLFMPMPMFEDLAASPHKSIEFFHQYFADTIPLIGAGKIAETFAKMSASPMISIKCRPYHYKNKVIIMGDAAHAMVPFYGQGMNCGFEDCLVFEEILDELYGDQGTDNFELALREFTRRRCPNGQAMCDLAMYNYIEMRDLVNSKLFVLRKHLDNFLYKIMPRTWIPLYTMVTFTRIPINECVERRRRQDKVLSATLKSMMMISVVGTSALLWLKRGQCQLSLARFL